MGLLVRFTGNLVRLAAAFLAVQILCGFISLSNAGPTRPSAESSRALVEKRQKSTQWRTTQDFWEHVRSHRTAPYTFAAPGQTVAEAGNGLVYTWSLNVCYGVAVTMRPRRATGPGAVLLHFQPDGTTSWESQWRRFERAVRKGVKKNLLGADEQPALVDVVGDWPAYLDSHGAKTTGVASWLAGQRFTATDMVPSRYRVRMSKRPSWAEALEQQDAFIRDGLQGLGLVRFTQEFQHSIVSKEEAIRKLPDGTLIIYGDNVVIAEGFYAH